MTGASDTAGRRRSVLLVSVSFPRPLREILPRGGLEACAFYVGRELAAHHDVAVVSARLEGDPEEERGEGLTVYRCGPSRPYVEYGDIAGRLLFARGAVELAVRLAPDVVIGYGLSSYWVAYRAARRSAARSVAFVADVYLDRWREMASPAAALIGRLAERFLLSRRWDRAIAISATTADRLGRLAPRAAVALVPPPVDLGRIRGLAARPPDDAEIVSTIARHVPYKRLDVLLRAIALLAPKRPALRCRLVGRGEQTPYLTALARSLGIVDRVEMCGTGEDHEFAWRAIKSSHVFCLPSSYEGFGMPVAEAFAAGVPAIVSDIPALRELAADGECAHLVPPGDAGALAAAIERLFDDPAAAAALVRRAAVRAEGFDLARVAALTEAALFPGSEPPMQSGPR